MLNITYSMHNILHYTEFTRRAGRRPRRGQVKNNDLPSFILVIVKHLEIEYFLQQSEVLISRE